LGYRKKKEKTNAKYSNDLKINFKMRKINKQTKQKRQTAK
jgi:hypothetical protein